MKLGAQMFTVREFTTDLAGLSETLAKIAGIGYTSVQLSATCPYEPEWMKTELEKNSLTCAATHTNPAHICENPEKTAKEHLLYGCKYVGIGCAPGLFEDGVDYESFRETFLPAAQALHRNGCVFAYHNHHIEFEKSGGVNMLERMAVDFPPDMLTFILDTYWIQYSGADSAWWIEKLSGQVHSVHLKDMSIVSGGQRMAAVGEGNMNFEKILAACEVSGTQYLLVEQDDCYGEDPFDCLRRSYEYLQSLGLK